MSFKSALALSTLAVLASANPWGNPKPTTTSSAPQPTPTGGFIAACENYGISILDCTELGNIAALNGNTVNVGSGSTGSAAPVNNGGEFVAACKNYGISIADCAELLNVAILNGNTVDIDLADLTALVTAIGGILPTGLPLTGLIPIPLGLL